jgi:hypothetical protein
MDQGRFKHWSVKMPGKNRGMRFIDRASFEAFLASIREGVEAWVYGQHRLARMGGGQRLKLWQPRKR